MVPSRCNRLDVDSLVAAFFSSSVSSSSWAKFFLSLLRAYLARALRASDTALDYLAQLGKTL